MSLDRPDEESFDGRDLSVAIVAARFNPRMVDGLLRHCRQVLVENNVSEERIEVVRVPGSNEIPYAVGMLANSGQFDVIVGLGLVMAGETPHHEVIADSTGMMLQQIAVSSEIPVINGIVVVHTEAQAEARCLGEINRGREFGLAALEMGVLGQHLVDNLNDMDAALGDLGAFDEESGPEFWEGFGEKGDNPWKL
jgi:6,7-dimethyl-8-ribityllumazine synthase